MGSTSKLMSMRRLATLEEVSGVRLYLLTQLTITVIQEAQLSTLTTIPRFLSSNSAPLSSSRPTRISGGLRTNSI